MQAYPKPVISCIGFQLPTVGIDDTAAQVEGELLMAKQRLRMAEEMAGSGTEATLDEALSVDRCALKLVQHAIKVRCQRPVVPQHRSGRDENRFMFP